MMNTDTVTIYKKSKTEDTWSKTVVHGVQWSDHVDKTTTTGRVSRKPYASITFFIESDEYGLNDFGEEDIIVYGDCEAVISTVKGSRPSDVVEANVKSGFITSVNDNTNRDHLKNMKVVVSCG